MSTVAWAQTGLVVAPRQIALVAVEGSKTDAVETLTISSTPANIDFTATVRDSSAVGGWLTISPTSGKTPATIIVSAKAGKLPAGVYTAQVVVTAGTLASVSNVVFSVGSTSGAIVASPTGLTFFDKSFTPVFMSDDLSLTLPGAAAGQSMSYIATATSIGNWLTVSPFPASAPGTLTVSASTTGLEGGTYTGAITIIPATGLPTVVPVTLVTAGTVPPPTPIILSQSKLSYRIQTRPLQAPLAAPFQSVLITVGGDLKAPYTATVSDSWMQVSSLLVYQPSTTVSGITPDTIYVTVVPDGLDVGTHTGSVLITSSGHPDRVLPVEVTVGTDVQLNVNPSSAILNEANGYKLPVTVFPSGSANVSFTATPDPSTPWLKVSPTAVSTPYGSVSLAITANTTGLEPGPYLSEVTLTPSGSSAAPATIPVQLDVAGSSTGPGSLAPSPTGLTFTGVSGVAVPAQTIALDSTKTGAAHAITAAAVSDKGWLKVDPFEATAPTTVTVSINPAVISAAGIYTGEIDLTSLYSGKVTIVPVTYVLSARGIAANRTSLSFTCPELGVAPPPQTLNITANTPSSFAITGPSWIRANPASGPTPATVTVSVDPSGLKPGTTTGTLKVSGPDNTLSISVSVTMPGPPAVTVAPQNVSFAYTLGGTAPSAATLNIGTTNGKPLSFTAVASTTDNGKWLAVSPSSGTAPTTLTASVDVSKLPAGSYSGAIVVKSANGDSQSIPVALEVDGSPVVDLLIHAATLAPTPISPGLIMAITGSSLGPSGGFEGQQTSAGAISTQLAGTRVLFDGIPAPLLYVRSDQINVIVPYAVYGRASTRLVVETPAGTSTPIDARVADTAPGVFTAQSSGTGQAAALNSDLSANSSSNPAARGSVIVVFGTGEGQTDPPGQDGVITGSDLRYPLETVSATVGGKAAEIVYFGSAPYLVSGVFQANIRIPADVDAGSAPVRIQVGDGKTQSNVTVAVR